MLKLIYTGRQPLIIHCSCLLFCGSSVFFSFVNVTRMAVYLRYRNCSSVACRAMANKEKRLYSFPNTNSEKGKRRYQLWAEIAENPSLGWEKVPSVFLCARHFARDQFRDEKCTRLIPGAIPTIRTVSPDNDVPEIHLLHPPSSEVDCSIREINVHSLFTPSSKASSFLPSFHTSTPKSCSTQLFSSFTEPIPSTSSGCDDSLVPLPDVFDDDRIAQKPKSKQNSLLAQVHCTRHHQLTPKKKFLFGHVLKYKKSLRKLQKKCKEQTLSLTELQSNWGYYKHVVKSMSKSMSLPSATILASQVRCAQRHPQGRRWTQPEKLIALSLYKRSPKCYTLLRSIFALPSKRTLITLLNSIPLLPGINSHIFKSLTESFTTSNEGKLDRVCSLMFDEMSIRQHLQYSSKLDSVLGFEDRGSLGRTNKVADHALVFMVRGLHSAWKQPLAFYFTHGGMNSLTMQTVLQDVLTACKGAGLCVVSLVCDMGPSNVRTLKQLGASKLKPYFTFDGQEVVVIYDAPHLLKCTRNMLYRHDVFVKVKVGDQLVEKKASWNHIRHAAAVDSVQPFRILRKFTPAHLDPVGQLSMKVNLAAQVLSYSVSSALCYNLSNAGLGPDAMATIHVTDVMNSAFDSVNGSSAAPMGSKGLRSQVRRERENLHLKQWATAADEIGSWKFLRENKKGQEVTFRPPSQDGWMQTLGGLALIWDHLKKLGFTFLSPRRLNQDAIEHLFGSIRAYCGSNCNPTVLQFVSALKTSIVNGLAFQDLAGNNCENEPDPGTLLYNLQGFLSTGSENNSSNEQVPVCVSEEQEVQPFDIPEDTQFSLQYVTGYIARKILASDTCSDCRTCVVSDDSYDWFNLGMCFKEYSDTKVGLTYPSYGLVKAVGAGVTALEDVLPRIAHLDGIMGKLKNHIRSSVDFKWVQEGCPLHHAIIVDCIVSGICCISLPWWCKKYNREPLSLKSMKSKPWTRKLRILQHK